jgi:hypothetical protein
MATEPIEDHTPVLQWAIIDGELRHLSEVVPCDRPAAAFCPACARPVILKLGSVRVHHIAHYPGDLCVATQPETVIHLNAKYHLLSVLKDSTSVFFMQKCDGCKETVHFCEHERPVHFAQNWDRVVLEYAFGVYRLDVGLIGEGELIGAIEVVVTHPCELDKVAYLNELNVPWLEIQVSPEFYTEPTAWHPAQALVPVQHNPQLFQPWQCDSCRERDAVERKEKAEREAKRQYAKNFKRLALRLVDFYYPNNKKYRSVFVIERWTGNGLDNAFFQLQEIGTSRQTIAKWDRTNVGDPLQGLKERLKIELSDKKKRQGWIVDNSRDWVKAPDRYHPKMFFDLEEYPFGYEWDGNAWQKAKPRDEKSGSVHPVQADTLVYESFSDNTKWENIHPLNGQPSMFEKEYICVQCGEKTRDWVSRFDAKTCLCRKCAYPDRK